MRKYLQIIFKVLTKAYLLKCLSQLINIGGRNDEKMKGSFLKQLV